MILKRKRMNKEELFDFMIDVVCLHNNCDKIERIKTMTFGDFKLNFNSGTWMKFCSKKCYKSHLELFCMVHHMITYNHSFPLKVWEVFLNELNKIKN